MIDPCKSDVGRMHEDLEHLRRLSALAPTDPDTRLAFARKLLDCGKTDEAIREIRAVIAMVPNHLEARKLLESAHELYLSGRTGT
jgi:predicted Zn-dependent protease